MCIASVQRIERIPFKMNNVAWWGNKTKRKKENPRVIKSYFVSLEAGILTALQRVFISVFKDKTTFSQTFSNNQQQQQLDFDSDLTIKIQTSVFVLSDSTTMFKLEILGNRLSHCLEEVSIVIVDIVPCLISGSCPQQLVCFWKCGS